MIAPLPAKRSLVDIAVEAIGDRLAEGVWPVGSRIPTEPELAELLGISRNTVREAVRVLLFAGLLEVRQGVGTYVRARVSPADAMRAISRASLRDQLEVRAMLEENCARLAARHASPADLDAIRHTLRERGDWRPDEPLEAFVLRDMAFHLAVADASGNAALAELYRYFSRSVECSIHHSIRDDSLPDPDLAAHAAIADAIARGDEEAAGRAAAAIAGPVLEALEAQHGTA